MPGLTWIYPGLHVKRWIGLICAGIFCIFLAGCMFIAYLLTTPEDGGSSKNYFNTIFVLFLIIGFAGTAFGIHGMTQTIVKVLSGKQNNQTRVFNKAMKRFALSEGPNVVAFGGGTGMSQLLSGLKEHTSNVSAIVTVADNGGHSGMLRQDMQMLPPGDVRQCLVALADSEPTMAKLLQYRFDSLDLEGFSFGNLFLAAMTKITGDFSLAVDKTSDILSIRGRVIPSTSSMVSLVATYDDGTRSTGEVEVGRSSKRITDLALKPNPGAISRDILDAIEQADIIVLSPGSLYTSILPNLIINGCVDALTQARAKVVYVCNTMTQPGETGHFSASDHIAALYSITKQAGWIDHIIVNNKAFPAELLDRYRQTGSQPVDIDHSAISAHGVSLIEDNFIIEGEKARHNPKAVAGAILQLIPG